MPFSTKCCQSPKIAGCSNFYMLECYSSFIAAVWQYFVLDSISWNTSVLFKFCYIIHYSDAITSIW